MYTHLAFFASLSELSAWAASFYSVTKWQASRLFTLAPGESEERASASSDEPEIGSPTFPSEVTNTELRKIGVPVGRHSQDSPRVGSDL